MLTLVVSADGTVTEATPIDLAPEPFASQARRAALGFRFTPAERAGVAVANKVRFELVFAEPLLPTGKKS